MNKQELIEILEELKESAKRNIETDNLVGYWQGKAETYDNAIGLAQQLDKPQKPVVPRSVGSLIEFYREKGVTLKHILNCFNEWADTDNEHTDEVNWIVSNPETFMRAWLDGYEVEKEPLYCVKIGKGYFSGFDETKVTYVIDDVPGSLTQRIKYDSKEEAEMDALQIGGTVEEMVEG
ncbi:DUF1642 domain-containing protein [Enterococcus thailandicus]|uniref:DUF1642 domain-containing protein n=1 Tax=Enterococcus thailandicus TaxID=417368 RepID=UPI0022E4CD86|nr:DUF1642 domain-containing protein [Enterococcus thailandicus]